MCGIIGVLKFEKWGIGYKEREVFHQLLVADALRGTTGTGAFIVKNDGISRSLKIGGHVYGLIKDKEWANFIDPKVPGPWNENNPNDIFLIGHNRFKTMGKASSEHAHPHKEGNILLVHNGTIPVYSNLPKFKTFEIDSKGLAHAIDTLGIEEAIKKTHGSYAIIYYNAADKTLNVLRNDERPLAICIDHENERVFFASEQKMLEWILHRSNLTNLTVSELVPDTLYTWELDSYIPKTREIKGPAITKFFNQNMSWEAQLESDLTTSFDMDDVTPKKEVVKENRIKGAIKKLGKIGINVKILPNLKGISKGDSLVFRICDYADENPNEETFIVMGESKTLHNTSIRFRLKGEKKLNAVFETPEMIAVVRNIVEYPQASVREDRYVIWVSDPNIYMPGTPHKEAPIERNTLLYRVSD